MGKTHFASIFADLIILSQLLILPRHLLRPIDCPTAPQVVAGVAAALQPIGTKKFVAFGNDNKRNWTVKPARRPNGKGKNLPLKQQHKRNPKRNLFPNHHPAVDSIPCNLGRPVKGVGVTSTWALDIC